MSSPRSGWLPSVLLVAVVFPTVAGAQQDLPSDVPANQALPPEDNVPELSPFAAPAPGRGLAPPASLADLDSTGEDIESKLEDFQAFSDATVTSASKRQQRIQDVPLTLSWIPASELEGTGQFTLCEAVQFFPGLECRRGAMRKAAVSARGLGSNFLSNRLLLLKDGRPETDPWTGIFYPDETTPLTNVKQIEVIRGPGSSLYGSNAFSGVINVVQRTPDDVMGEKKDFGADLRLLGGQFNTGRLQATVAGKAGPVKALVNAYGFRSDGPQLFNDPARGQVDDQQWSTVGQLSTRVQAGPLMLDVEYTNSHIGRPGGQQISSVGNCGRCHFTPNDSERVQNLNANLQGDVKVNDWLRVFGEVYTLFKRREVELENQITRELQPSLGKRRRLGGELRALISKGDLNVTVGGDSKFDTVNNQNLRVELSPDDTRQTIVGVFADAEYRPLPKLILGAGLRYDHYAMPAALWSNPEGQLSPRASIVYHLRDELTLRTNYGHAFRAPTLAELGINQQMYAATLIGNPDLRAESMDTLEVAVDVWPAQDKVRLTGTGFYTVASNFINQEHLLGSTSQFQNIGDARVIGFEAEAAAQVRQINSSFDIAYQYLDARSLPNSLRPGGSLDYAPNHRLYLRGHTNVSKVVFFDYYALFVGSRQDPAFRTDSAGNRTGEHVTLPSYLVATTRVGANVYEGLSVSLMASNLFNTNYQEMFGFPQAGLSLFSEVRYVH